MPKDLAKILENSHVVRLTTAVEIIYGEKFTNVLDYQKHAAIYELVGIAENAYDGATGTKIPYVKSATIRAYLCANAYTCRCDDCRRHHWWYTLREHLLEIHDAEMQYPDEMVLQFNA
ncbi:hypothetical protein Aduo_007687 [Ancylostoma duodenale]